MLVQTDMGARMVKPVSISRALPRYLDRLRRRRKRKKRFRAASGEYSDLNRFTGGLNAGELIVIAGRPSTGKTTLALNIALSAALDRVLPTAILSLGLTCNQVVSRLVASMARVDPSSLRGRVLTPKDWKRIERVEESLARAPILVCESHSLTTAQLPRLVRDLKDENGLGLVIVDELQELIPAGPDVHGVPTAQTVPRALKGMARELDVAVLAVSRLSRRIERRRSNRMVLSDLWGSGVEHDADLIVTPFKREFYIWGPIGSLKHHDIPRRK